jgi:hypothetical protein
LTSARTAVPSGAVRKTAGTPLGTTPDTLSVSWLAPPHCSTDTGARPRTRSSSAPPPPSAASPVATTTTPSRAPRLAFGRHRNGMPVFTSGIGTIHARPPDGVWRSSRADSGATGSSRKRRSAFSAPSESASSGWRARLRIANASSSACDGGALVG